MKRTFGLLVLLIGGFVAPVASGQSFLQRLNDQLNSQLAPPVVQQPAAPATLPPPVVQDGRASLGIHVGPVTDELQQTQRLAVRRGAIITVVEKNSPAERAGLRLGAVIVAFDGRRIDSPDDLINAVQGSRPGQEVELTIYEGDRLGRKRVILGGAPPAVLSTDNRATPLTPPPQPVPSPQGIDTPPPGSSNLERQLGAGGNRPLLGRIGRALDNLATPAQATAPVEPVITNRVDSDLEVQELRRQVTELSRELDRLRRTVYSLEKRLDEREAAASRK